MKTALLILLAALVIVSGVSVFATEELLVVPATLAIALLAVLAAADQLQRTGQLNARTATIVVAGALLISVTGVANLPRKLLGGHGAAARQKGEILATPEAAMARDIPGGAPK
ncbi:MAG: hypothetical protein JWO82_2866 [Akkermansiaceae bacterium]|nr:hypothetical protein [Akkermansiaceae bacterium]